MLHYSDDGSQIAFRRCPSGARRKGQVGDNEGSCTRARHSMLLVQLLQSNEFQSIGDIFEASPKLERGDALMSSTDFQLKFFLSWQPRLKQSKTPSLIYPGIQIGICGDAPNKGWVLCILGRCYFTHPTCGFLFTMNPGYASRTELPEDLKAFFLSFTMICPDSSDGPIGRR